VERVRGVCSTRMVVFAVEPRCVENTMSTRCPGSASTSVHRDPAANATSTTAAVASSPGSVRESRPVLGAAGWRTRFVVSEGLWCV